MLVYNYTATNFQFQNMKSTYLKHIILTSLLILVTIYLLYHSILELKKTRCEDLKIAITEETINIGKLENIADIPFNKTLKLFNKNYRKSDGYYIFDKYGISLSQFNNKFVSLYILFQQSNDSITPMSPYCGSLALFGEEIDKNYTIEDIRQNKKFSLFMDNAFNYRWEKGSIRLFFRDNKILSMSINLKMDFVKIKSIKVLETTTQ